MTVLHAGAAGGAPLGIDVRHIVGTQHVRRLEKIADTECVAGAVAAVADGGGAVKAIGLIEFMDKTVVLGSLQDLIGLFLGDIVVCSGFGIGMGIVVEVDAHILFQVSAALTHEAAGPAAGAGTDGDGFRILDERGNLVVIGHFRVVLYGSFHGNDPHEGHAGGGIGAQDGHAPAGVLLEADAEIRVLVALFPVGHDAFHDARDPDGIVIIGLSVPDTAAHCTGFNELIQQFQRLFLGKAGFLCHFFQSAVGVETQVHEYFTHLVIDDGFQNPVLGIIVGDAGVGQALHTDLRSQFQDVGSVISHFFLLPAYVPFIAGYILLPLLIFFRCCFNVIILSWLQLVIQLLPRESLEMDPFFRIPPVVPFLLDSFPL